MSAATEQKRRVVLVVEDDGAVRRVVQLALDRSGFDVVAVDTGTRALASLEHGGIDAVVLDLGLPDSRAPDVLAGLHAHDDKPSWVVISGGIDRADAVRLDPLVGTRFLAKPFDPWELVRRIAALAGGDEEGATR